MKKKLVMRCFVALGVMAGLTGCGSKDKEETGGSDDEYKVLLLIPGNLGDKSFFDSANSGLKMVEEQLDGTTTKVIEMGTDETKWEPNLIDAAEEDWDLIISGNSASAIMNEIAEEYPEKQFINFDNSGEGAVDNVYSVSYATNEGSFLGGALSGLVTQSDMELANEENVIGFIGGMDIPGINDFLVGYIQGAQHVNPEVKVLASYVGTFTDPAKGKELSLVQYDSGVDISFNVAGQSGLGLIDAALEKDKYALGVDSDQAMLYKDSEPEKAERILSSVVKNIDTTLFNSVKSAKEGELEFGKHELLGIKAGAVGLAKNDYYENLPQEIKDQLTELEEQVADGTIEVKSGFTMSTDEITDYRNSVKP